MSKAAKKPIYPGGFIDIIDQMEDHMEPLEYAEGEALAPLDVDLGALKTRMTDPFAPETQGSHSTFARKYRSLAKEFSYQPAILHLHGLLIANLRRVDQPDHAAALFVRLWEEEADFLLDHLNPRWLVSAATTFGDHGTTAGQRQLGQALSVMFGMLKLYETERLYSNHAPDQAFSLKSRAKKPLPVEMSVYSLANGGLDVNMLGALWKQAETEPALKPLAQRLLNLLIEDPGTVFRRLHTMRRKRQKTLKKKGLKVNVKRLSCVVDVPQSLLPGKDQAHSWGTVSLAKAPLPVLARFAAYHLDLGAQNVCLYLDDPEPGAADFLSTHPNVTVIPCDDAFWATQKKPRMKAHQQRQVWVATQAYHQAQVNWLAHIDVDEFLLPDPDRTEGMQAMLRAVPDTDAVLRLLPAEMLASDTGPALFKLLPERASTPIPPEDLYPNFGNALPDGFLSHRAGKTLLRTGLDGMRMGIHAPLHKERTVSNMTTSGDVYVGHAHAPTWQAFRDKLDFRLLRGSYRKSAEDKLQLRDILEFMKDQDGEDGLRMFYTEMNQASGELVGKLDQHGLLLRRDLDLDAKVIAQFGALPTGAIA